MPERLCVCLCVCACVFMSECMCAFVSHVLWFCDVALVSLFGLFLDFVSACACTVIKPELSPSHLTTKEHEVEKFKEEEQIQLLLEADGRSAP